MNVTDVAHGLSWHEDDDLHQAEGMLSVRLGIPIAEAVDALRARSVSTGQGVHEVALLVLHQDSIA